MQNPHIKVTLARTATNKPAVSVSIKTGSGRIYHSEPLALGDAPLATLIQACIAKAQGREEAEAEAVVARKSARTQSQAGE